MKIELNLEKKYFLALFTLGIVLIGMISVVAYTQGFPGTQKDVAAASNYGHTADEVVVNIPDVGLKTLHEAILDGNISTSSSSCEWKEIPQINCNNNNNCDGKVNSVVAVNNGATGLCFWTRQQNGQTYYGSLMSRGSADTESEETINDFPQADLICQGRNGAWRTDYERPLNANNKAYYYACK